MSELHALLIECRIVLREALADGGCAALSQRLDAAIQSFDGGLKPAALPPATQVALAWQTAARNLKHSHPAVYAGLNARVMEILGTRLPEGPVEELLRLEREVAALRQTQDRHAAELAARDVTIQQAQTQLGSVYAALADAVPEIDGSDPEMLALARIEVLVARAQAPRNDDGARPGGAASAAPDSPVPDENLLRQVSAGRRQFSKEQRDWVVGEALGLTGWRMTPLELIDKGDAWLAQRLLEGDHETA